MPVRNTIMLLIAILAGCGPTPDVELTTVRDSAGITIVDNGDLDRERDLLVSSIPAVHIGVIDGAPEYQLFRVSDAKRLSDGGVVVANAGSRELRIYNVDGTHRVTAGGAGDGPSEFRYPGALHVLRGDTIQVQDFMDRVYFTAQGDFIRRETTDRAALAAVWERTGGASEGGQWMADGTFFAPMYRRNQGSPVPGPLARPPMTLVRVSGDFATIDTLGVFGGILQQYIDVGGARGRRFIIPPFFTNSSWALGAADGSVIVGDNAAPQIHRFSADGSHIIVRWTAAPESGSASEIEAWKERQRAAEWAQTQLPQLERAWAVMDVPETKPYYGQVTTGSDGTMWVGAVDDLGQGGKIISFNSDGHYVGFVDLPGRFTPYDSGPGWVLGLLRDEQDVEYVQVFDLHIR